MAGKYDNYFKDYENQVKSSVFTGYADKQMNWISTSKDSPLIYVQLLQDELLPVPFHSYVELSNGKHARFACRKFIHEECKLCDNLDHLNKEAGARTSYIANAIEFKTAGPRQFVPVMIDYKVSKDTGEEVLKEFPNLNVIKDNDAYTFQKLPKVGVLTGKRAINEALPLVMTQFGQIQGEILCISRSGQGLETKYTAMRIDDSNLNLDSEPVKAAIELSKNIEDYIDDYISEDKVKSAFPSFFNDAKTSEQSSNDSEAKNDSAAYEDADTLIDTNSMSDKEMEDMIAKMYNGSSN